MDEGIYVDEPLEDVLPDESDIEPEPRGILDALSGKLRNEDDAGKDDDEPPFEDELWQE